MRKDKKEKIIFKYFSQYIPQKANEGDGAYDLKSTGLTVSITNSDDIQVRYNLGIKSEFPEGYVALVFPRSSISKTRLRLANSVGFIDSGYRGFWGAVFDFKYSLWEKIKYKLLYGKLWAEILVNDSLKRGEIYNPGKLERCCQFCLVKLADFDIEITKDLSSSERGEGGFGSTGK